MAKKRKDGGKGRAWGARRASKVEVSQRLPSPDDKKPDDELPRSVRLTRKGIHTARDVERISTALTADAVHDRISLKQYSYVLDQIEEYTQYLGYKRWLLREIVGTSSSEKRPSTRGDKQKSRSRIDKRYERFGLSAWSSAMNFRTKEALPTRRQRQEAWLWAIIDEMEDELEKLGLPGDSWKQFSPYRIEFDEDELIRFFVTIGGSDFPPLKRTPEGKLISSAPLYNLLRGDPADPQVKRARQVAATATLARHALRYRSPEDRLLLGMHIEAYRLGVANPEMDYDYDDYREEKRYGGRRKGEEHRDRNERSWEEMRKEAAAMREADRSLSERMIAKKLAAPGRWKMDRWKPYPAETIRKIIRKRPSDKNY